MRFKDLVEGKVYNISNSNNNLSYKLVDNLLFNIEENEYSYNSMIEIAHHDFTEVIEYHTFEEAITHMVIGCDASIHGLNYHYSQNNMSIHSSTGTPVILNLKLLEPKWQLL